MGALAALVSLLLGACNAGESDATARDDVGPPSDSEAGTPVSADSGVDAEPPKSEPTALRRRYWSASYGHFVPGGNPWVRHLDYTFTPSEHDEGSVSADVEQWGATTGPDRTVAATTGPCNGTSGCAILQPTPTLSERWSGTYRFAEGALNITWSSGSTESWSVDEVRSGTLGRMTLVGSSFPGSDPNKGRGYGSVQPFSVYKKAGAVDSVTGIFKGFYDRNVVGLVDLEQIWNFDMGGLAAEGPGAKTLHLTQSPTGTGNPKFCPGDLQNIKGNIYHLFVNNADRRLVENNYFRCLLKSETGCYSGGMHIAVLRQVIDDAGSLVGLVGVEASTSGGFTYARIDALAP